jgi:hypothetical protein
VPHHDQGAVPQPPPAAQPDPAALVLIQQAAQLQRQLDAMAQNLAQQQEAVRQREEAALAVQAQHAQAAAVLQQQLAAAQRSVEQPVPQLQPVVSAQPGSQPQQVRPGPVDVSQLPRVALPAPSRYGGSTAGVGGMGGVEEYRMPPRLNLYRQRLGVG